MHGNVRACNPSSWHSAPMPMPLPMPMPHGLQHHPLPLPMPCPCPCPCPFPMSTNALIPYVLHTLSPQEHSIQIPKLLACKSTTSETNCDIHVGTLKHQVLKQNGNHKPKNNETTITRTITLQRSLQQTTSATAATNYAATNYAATAVTTYVCKTLKRLQPLKKQSYISEKIAWSSTDRLRESESGNTQHHISVSASAKTSKPQIRMHAQVHCTPRATR